jgi:predicted Fe-Mo cluster-binding NifX family protein
MKVGPLKIGVSSQNFRTITGHAGKGRRFMVFETSDGAEVQEAERLDLPKEMSLHEWNGQSDHPLFELDYLITGSCGDGFIRKLNSRGVMVKVTSETDPLAAAKALLAGTLPEGAPHAHEHGHDHHGHHH